MLLSYLTSPEPWFPNVVEQCRPGFTQTVIFRNPTLDFRHVPEMVLNSVSVPIARITRARNQDRTVRELQLFIRNYHPTCSFITTNLKGKVTQSAALEEILALDRFNTPENRLARLLEAPRWEEEGFEGACRLWCASNGWKLYVLYAMQVPRMQPEMESVVLRFPIRLSQSRLIRQLNSLVRNEWKTREGLEMRVYCAKGHICLEGVQNLNLLLSGG